MRQIAPMLALLALAACEDGTGTAPPPAEGDDPCRAAPLQDDIGKPVGELTITVVDVVRTLGPNDAATMDYRPTRLNLEIEDGRLRRAYCG